MHAEIFINAIVLIFAAFIGAWFGAKFQAKQSERAHEALFQRLNEASNSLSAIARRLPGGEAYASVKQAEWQLEQQTSKSGS